MAEGGSRLQERKRIPLASLIPVLRRSLIFCPLYVTLFGSEAFVLLSRSLVLWRKEIYEWKAFDFFRFPAHPAPGQRYQSRAAWKLTTSPFSLSFVSIDGGSSCHFISHMGFIFVVRIRWYLHHIQSS
jgi:hypothetical protein